jgi:uncharacterized protein YciI
MRVNAATPSESRVCARCLPTVRMSGFTDAVPGWIIPIETRLRVILGHIAVFAVTQERFNQWDWSRDMREQDNWEAHAAFIDELTEQGFIVLGGPVGDGRRVLLIVESDDESSIEERFAADPWIGTHLRIERIEPWDVLIRAREAPGHLHGR